MALPTFTVNLKEKINCFELGWSEFMTNFAVVALTDKIILALVKFPEDSTDENFEFRELKELHSEATRIEALAISPDSSIAVIPNHVIFCAAGSDFLLRVYSSDLQSKDTVQTLSGHKSYINSIAYDFGGQYLASGSDDHTVALWNSRENYKKEATYYFKSAVMSCKWHPAEPEKLLVAEKSGNIHLLAINRPRNVLENSAEEILLTVQAPRCPLMSADWALSNSAFICCLAGGDKFVWDLKTPSRPIDAKTSLHHDVGIVIKFLANTELATASIGKPLTTLKIIDCKSQLPQVEAPLTLFGGIGVHTHHPYVVIGQDRKLCFFKILIQ